MRLILLAGSILLLPHASATTVQRCQAPDGHVTFTLQGCPDDSQLQLQAASNPTPGGDHPALMAAPPVQSASPASKQPDARARNSLPPPPATLQVVGQRDDGCGNRLSASQKRSAGIRQQVQAGMTRQDVESAFGKPQKISRSNGQTRYHYSDAQGNTRRVSFDEAGCVEGQQKRNR